MNGCEDNTFERVVKAQINICRQLLDDFSPYSIPCVDSC